MNTNSPEHEREQLEARVTALLLGELGASEAEEVERAIETDPELAKSKARLERTIELIKGAVGGQGAACNSGGDMPRLSDARRRRLRELFASGNAPSRRVRSRASMDWAVPLSIAAAFVVLMGFASLLLGVGSFGKSRGMAARPNVVSSVVSRLNREPASAIGERDYSRRVAGGRPVAGQQIEAAAVEAVPSLSQEVRKGTPVVGVSAGQAGQRAEGTKAAEGRSIRVYLPTEARVAERLSEKADKAAVADTSGKDAAAFGRPVGAPAAATGVQAPTDIRMLMRYGLLPKDSKVSVRDRSQAEGVERNRSAVAATSGGIGGAEFGGYDTARRVEIARQADESVKVPARGTAQVPAVPPPTAMPPASQPVQQERAFSAQEAATKQVELGNLAPTLGTALHEKRLSRAGGAGGFARPVMSADQESGKGVLGPGQEATASAAGESMAEDVRARTGAAGKPVAGAGVAGQLGLEPVNGPDAAVTEVTERFAGLSEKEGVSSSKFVPVLGDSPAAGRLFSFAYKEGALDSRGIITNAVPEPQPEVLSAENPLSTFSLNISDVSFRLAAASFENGAVPPPASIRSEEFINAFDYRDPEPAAGMPMAFNWERAHYPFAHNRDIIRFSIRTAAFGRDSVRPLNLVLLLDSSGSMERADRVLIIREALRVLSQQLRPEDVVSVVGFARTARLWVDALSGDRAEELVERVGNLTPEGGTNLEDALKLAYETAARHFLPNGVNRIVLLTDGAANLGDVEPESLKRMVTEQRKRGIALDCFGIGWEGYNDELLEVLSRNGDGRYGFVNTPEEAATDFAAKLAGALQVAAADVKVQVEFNPHRVVSWRQIGYAKHKLTAEQFRDNTVDAAEVAAAESGNALYVIQTKPEGEGNICVVRVRYREPASGLYREMSWPVPYTGIARPLEKASAAMRLAVVAGAFSERLASNPYASEVKTGSLLSYLNGVPEAFDLDPRPRKLEWMLREYQRIAGE
ncbi:MAG: von Willebrand factor type A domain-containing protein [Verrucomicrobiota bacterium]|nr:von Willebrand factor type A domain-containing protein [Verrucomicrobiota bacterium]